MNDLRFAFRQLLKAPGFTVVAVLTLALGIGACTLVFSWIRSVLLDTIPGARDPGRLVVLAQRHVTGEVFHTLSMPDVRDLRSQSNVFTGIIASQIEPATLRTEQELEWVWTQPVTANFFDVLRVTPALGRTFLPDEDQAPGGNAVVVISHRLWQRRFGGSPGVLGRNVEIARRPFTIIGVAPAGFRGTMGGLALDLWVPLTMSNEYADISRALTSRGWRWLHTIARLRDGVSLAQAQAATDIATRQLEAEYPQSNKDVGTAVRPVYKAPWGIQASLLPLLTALAGVAILLLLLVIANVANLLLARASSRENEMAVRLALGARATRLVRQVLIESLVLASLGGVLGAILAATFSRALLWLLPTTYLPVGIEFLIDLRVLAFVTAITVATGILFGLAPAWHAARANIAGTLKAGGRTGGGSRHSQRVRQTLVVAEIAAALVLLIGMMLCARSFDRARHLHVGLQPDNVWVAGFRLPPGAYSSEEAASFYRRLRTELSQLPGVRSVGLTDWLPLGFEGGSSTRFAVPGYQAAPGERIETGISVVSPGYFPTLRIDLIQGRDFDERDSPSAAPVVIVNEHLARRYFPGRDALGLTIQLWDKPRTIIGITRTGKYTTLNEPPRSYAYVPVEQTGDHTLTAVLRTEGPPASIASAVERTARDLDPNVRPVAALPMTQYMAAAYLVPRTAAVLLTVLGAIAVLLAGLGIYGVIAWSVGRRTREVGIRMALGANRHEVTWLFVSHGLHLTAAGLALGLIGALLGGRILGSLLVGISSIDPLTYIVALPALTTVAVLACWLPARKAAHTDPIAALRTD